MSTFVHQLVSLISRNNNNNNDTICHKITIFLNLTNICLANLSLFDTEYIWCTTASCGNVELLELLLHRRLVRILHGNALILAAQAGHCNAVSWFHQHGWYIDSAMHFADDTEHTALSIAIQAGHDNVVEYLVNKAFVPDAHVAMIRAAGAGQIFVVQMLINNGIHVNCKDNHNYNRTALHLAAIHNQYCTIQYLLQCDADFTLLDDHADTAEALAPRDSESYTLLAKSRLRHSGRLRSRSYPS